MLTNVHLALNEFRNESRVLRETQSLLASGLVQRIDILALHGSGLEVSEQLGEGRRLTRIKLASRGWPPKKLFQLAKYLEFAARALSFCWKRKPEMVNAHSLAVLPLGLLLKILLGSKLIYDTHELETETDGLGGFQKRMSKFVERLCIKYVDLTITVSSGISDWYRSSYGIGNVVTVLNSPTRRSVTRPGKLRQRLGIDSDTKICLYQGLLTKGRGVEVALDAFSSTPDPAVVLVFMGYGDMESTIREAATKSPSIRYCPAVPPSELLEYTVDADVGLSLIEDSCLSYRYCLPNKLFEYTMAGLPVVCSDLPEMAKIVRRFNCGEVIDKPAPLPLRAAIARLLAADKAQLAANLDRLSEQLCWGTQEEVMISAYKKYLIRD